MDADGAAVATDALNPSLRAATLWIDDWQVTIDDRDTWRWMQ